MSENPMSSAIITMMFGRASGSACRPHPTSAPVPSAPMTEPIVFAAKTRALAGPASRLPAARIRAAKGNVAPMQVAAGSRTSIEIIA